MHHRMQPFLAFLLSCYLLLCDCNPKLSSGMVKSEKVEVKIRYRTFCAACQYFIASVIIPIIKDERFRDIVTFRLLPIGGMAIQKSQIVCEDGPSECEGHKWHACLLEKATKEPYIWLEKLACLEAFKSGDLNDWDSNIVACVLPSELKELSDCFQDRSEKILKKMLSDEAGGRILWLPHITLDGRLLGNATMAVGLLALEEELCRAYKGDIRFYPNTCNHFPGLSRNTGDPVDKTGPASNQNRLRNGHDRFYKQDMKVYWRAFCPASRIFMVKVLPRLLNDIGFQRIIEFHSIPGAGTSVSPSGKFICEGGDEECNAHKWLSCINLEIQNVTVQLNHISCVENYHHSTHSWDTMAANCELDPKSGEALQKCYSTKSSALLKKIIEQVEVVKPAWMPYVVLDGKKIGDSELAVTYEVILKEICDAYKGETKNLPAACNEQLLQDIKKSPETAPIKPCKPKNVYSVNTKDEYTDPPDIGPRYVVKQIVLDEADKHAARDFGRDSLPSELFPTANLHLVLLCAVFVAFCAAWYLRSRNKAHHF